MGVVLSCGHQVSSVDDGTAVTIKDWARDCSRVLSYEVYCDACADRCRRDGTLAESVAEEHAWLAGAPDLFDDVDDMSFDPLADLVP